MWTPCQIFGRLLPPMFSRRTERFASLTTLVDSLLSAITPFEPSQPNRHAFGYQAVEETTTGYDLDATSMHLLGIDHERLTVRNNGVDRRLTDVHGRVLNEIVA